MDGSLAIEFNTQALKRILAGLVAMAGFAMRAGPMTLPRHMHLGILRLLRPAEAATRRLIIALALAASPQARKTETPASPQADERNAAVVALPRPRKPKPKPMDPVLRSLGIAIVLPPAEIAARAAADRLAAARAARRQAVPARLAFPLFDPLRNPFRRRGRYVPQLAVPRILFLGDSRPAPLPRSPSSHDPIDATRLGLRLAALGRALDDMPAQARRFARWKARCDALDTQNGNPIAGGTHRFRRLSPLRPGRPPGCRLPRYDPSAKRRKNVREVDEVLAHAHALARFALEYRDTS